MPKREIRGQRNKLSLTTLLIGLVSLSVLLTSTILLIASYESKKQALIDTTLQLNYTNADKMSQTIDSLFRSMRTSLEYSSTTLSGKINMNTDVRDEYLELLRNSSNYFNSLVIINEKGVITNEAPKNLGTVGKHVTTETGKKAISSQKPFLSEPDRATTGRLMVIMSQPIFDKIGNYRGVIAGTLYLQDYNVLTMIFGSNNMDNEGSYYYIVGSDGKLLFHPDRNRISEDVSDNKVVQKLKNGKSGQERVTNTRGEDMFAGYSSVPANGWGVVKVSSNAVVHKQLNSHIRNILWYILIPFVILLLVVILIAHELARPFVYLANLVNKIGKEKVEFPERKPHWNREADLLTKTILLAIVDFQKHTDQLTQEAMTDSLTGLTNRRNFESVMDHLINAGHPFSLIVLDVDKFKYVNDTYGHQAGDDVLRQIAKVISASVRPGDICSRYGGEEFVILLTDTSLKDAYIIAERVRKVVETSKVSHSLLITVSQGIAHFPSQAKSSDQLFHLADQALYAAKESGRNKVVISP